MTPLYGYSSSVWLSSRKLNEGALKADHLQVLGGDVVGSRLFGFGG